MNITNVNIRLIKTLDEKAKLKAVASIVIDDCIAVHDIKILQGEDSLFIAMPSKKLPNGTFKDITHPINSECREKLTEMILSQYKVTLEEDTE